MESVGQLALLLVAVLGGAIVALLVARSTQASSASMQQYSKDVTSLAIESLASTEREVTRDRSLNDLANQLEALNVTVGNLYQIIRNSPAGQASRTVISRPMQVGEVPPDAPPIRVTRTQEPLPPEGLETEPGSPSPAALRNRATAFAEPM